MALTINKDIYKELIFNTVNQYSSTVKKTIVKRLKEENKVTFDIKKSRTDDKYPILCDSIDEAIKATINDEYFFSFYENWDFEKSYKYSVPLAYESDLDNELTFDESVMSLIRKGKLLSFAENVKFNVPDSIASDIKECTPYYKKDKGYALFKFLIKEYTSDENFETVEVRYPIIISINLEKKFLEIRFDGGRFEYKTQSEYIIPKIKYCIKWLKEILCLKLYNINTDSTIDTINNRPVLKPQRVC